MHEEEAARKETRNNQKNEISWMRVIHDQREKGATMRKGHSTPGLTKGVLDSVREQ